MRYSRRGAALLSAALLLLVAAPAAAAQPRIYHTIDASFADAVVVEEDGCVRTEVYVSASVGKYAEQPGPVVKQGLTGVLVRVLDVCAGAAAAAPGGGVVVAEYSGRAMVALEVDPRLRWAHVSATLPVDDQPGVAIELSATWTGVGPLDHSTGHTHELVPGVGVVASAGNELSRAAVADVVVRVADVQVAGRTEDAHLSRVKSHCIEVPRPGVDEFYPCFGFPA